MDRDDKSTCRQILRAARQALGNREEAGLAIWDQLRAQPEWTAARSLLLYVDVRGEVPTRDALREELMQEQRRVALPWCDGDELRAVLVRSMDEMKPGRFGIPEPIEAVRNNPDREMQAADFDLIVIPAVGFDRHGQRLGSGRGYYDRFLAAAGSETCLCGIGFDCQLVDVIPTEPHDRLMDLIVTESQVLRFT